MCFYSNIFGLVTRKVIHVSSVEKIQRATHLYLPNSIQIILTSSKKYFFTSFLSRDEAFVLIAQSWQRWRDDPLNPKLKEPVGDDTVDILPQLRTFPVRPPSSLFRTIIKYSSDSKSRHFRGEQSDASATL